MPDGGKRWRGWIRGMVGLFPERNRNSSVHLGSRLRQRYIQSNITITSGSRYLDAGVRLEFTPKPQRLLSQPDVLRVRIGEPKDPGAPMGTAAIVARLELLEDHHVPMPTAQPPCGG